MRSLPFSAAIWIAIAAPAFAQTISESPNPAAPNAALSVPFTDPGAQVNDNIWIQDANGNHLQVLFLNGTTTPPSAPITSGTITAFTAPATPGDYLIYGGFHGTAAGPASFTVSSGPPPSTASIDLSDGSKLAPVAGDVVGVTNGAFAMVPPQAGPAGPQGAQGAPGVQGPAGQNAGQDTYPSCPAPTAAASVGQSMFCSANGHTDIAVSPAANTWWYFGPAQATAP